ncbi:hypothetical protein RSO41_03260 [Halomonas sp. I1]|uniref:maleate cis-trans isomerase family protein n=1 Tax=Halomonas sp. I1 TaxID=393536 RepID=UPI0028DEB966|nr:hypothetical protein [Halomonas sp. I1]MDT8893663.1 hypothetical protein [Halomonas sp. I1]
MSKPSRLGILLPDDGPEDYEWYAPGRLEGGSRLPCIDVGAIPSDGHHVPAALLALGATERLLPVGEELVHRRGVGALVWACTSGSFIGGLSWACRQAEELEAALGVPVTSTALAFRDALEALDCRSLDLLSPYPDEVTLRLVSFLRECGVEVVHSRALDCPYAADSNAADILGEVRRFAAAHPTTRPLMVPDTAVNSLALRPALCREAGRDVLTANQVTLWAGLRRLGEALPKALLGPLADS